MFPEVTAEIFADRLIHNLNALRSRCRPGTRLCVPLKADAYGHGLRIMAPIVQQAGADCAAVANLDEAIELRDAGWHRPILVLGHVLATSTAADRRARLDAVFAHDLTLTLCDHCLLPELQRAALTARRTIDVHLKIDTGMGRMGFMPQQALRALEDLHRFPAINLAGIYSHFGTADLAERAQADDQFACFRTVLDAAAPHVGAHVIRHLANTSATIERPETHFDMVRPGIGLYGYSPADRLAAKIDLRPALRLTSRVTLIKDLPAGHAVGYGRKFITARPTRLGLIPVGYHDGYVRALLNRTIVGTASGDAPVIGRVSMDQLAIDLTQLPTVMPGDPVTLIDERPNRPNSVNALAKLLDTIPYEVVCLLGRRIERVRVAHAKSAGSTPYEVRMDENLNIPSRIGRSSVEQSATIR